jgi:hypothetical protein
LVARRSIARLRRSERQPGGPVPDPRRRVGLPAIDERVLPASRSPLLSGRVADCFLLEPRRQCADLDHPSGWVWPGASLLAKEQRALPDLVPEQPAHRRDGSGNKTPNAILELGRTDEKAVVSLPLLPTGDNLNPFSWSRDGRFLAGFRDRQDRSTEVLLYSFNTGRWESVDPSGRAPLFLSDSRRLLFEKDNGIVLYDTETKRSKQILPAGTLPDGWAMKFSVSKDDRQIAYIETQREGDIWMMNFGAMDTAGKKP